MSYRFMRVLVFFDLPTLSNEDLRNYRQFRKFLIKEGFVMMQESVYSKIALNPTASNLIIKKLKKNKPCCGLVQMLCVTEKQFNSMEFIVGEAQSRVINNDERLIIL